MREFMLIHEPAEGWSTYGVTLTIPGPVMEIGKAKSLFARWCQYVEREMKACAVWRVEIQDRGALHWHCLVCVDNKSPVRAINIRAGEWKPWGIVRVDQMDWIRWAWFKALDDAGPQHFSPAYVSGAGTQWAHRICDVESLMQLPGAWEHAVDVRPDDGRGAWKRYLQDHASKVKQAQVIEYGGRHWGVVGRKRFMAADVVGLAELSDRQYYAVVRGLQRLATPQLRARRERCPFGRRLGRRIRRGSWGASVWFSRPATCQRLIEWARSSVTVGTPKRMILVDESASSIRGSPGISTPSSTTTQQSEHVIGSQ